MEMLMLMTCLFHVSEKKEPWLIPLISLKRTIHRLQNPINPQITKTANEELDSLRSMLKRLDNESSRSIDRSVMNELDAKIREAVWKLEDVLDSYQPSQGLDQKGGEQEIDSFLKRAENLREEYERELLQNPLPREEDNTAAVSPIHKYSTTVGLSDLSDKIMNDLLHGTSERIDVSLVGMAGIGKTHHATQIYHHPLIVKYFDLRAWVRVGPKDPIIHNIHVDIVAQIERKPRDLFKKTDEETLTYNSLHGRRYLIVFDDIWSKEVLYIMTKLLPYDSNGSRFLLTTRQQEVAKCLRRGKVHQMPFLNNEESWNLLWQNVFAVQSFSSALEKAGRKIAELCEGLPLLILVVADILRGLDKTEDCWKKVAEKKTTTFTDAFEKIYEVLLPSYEYLPQHLKACFLYMGVFRQSCEIPSSKLINFWAVEEFLELSWGDFGIKFLEDIVSKSLAIACKWSSQTNSKGDRWTKSSRVHCAYWHLCVKEARKIKLFHVLNKLTDVSIESQRRLSVQNNILLGIKGVYDSMAAATSTTRSLLCMGEDHQYQVRICFNTMLLIRVLDALALCFYEFPNEVVNLLQLRYLALTNNGEIPCSISNLQQLQYLILRRHHNIKLLQRDPVCLPVGIWDLQELRHLRIMGSDLPDPSEGAKLPKLLTLYVHANSCREYVFENIPGLKKLGIRIELQPDAGAESLGCLKNIWILKRLVSLKCVVVNPFKVAIAPSLFSLYLPWSLKKLSLNGLGYLWKDIRVCGALQKLQVLKLRCSAFQGPHWESETNHFLCLQYLLLEDMDLVHWTVQDMIEDRAIKFLPNLKHLIIRHCYKLKMIPSEIGDIETLETIEVDDCSPSVVASAHQIKEKTNEPSHLQIGINSSWN